MRQLCDAQNMELQTTNHLIDDRIHATEAARKRVNDLRYQTEDLEIQVQELVLTSRERDRRTSEEEQRRNANTRRQQLKLEDARNQHAEALALLQDSQAQLDAFTRSVQAREAQLRIEVEELGVKTTEVKVKSSILQSELDDRDRELEMQKLIREQRIEEGVRAQIAERQSVLAQIRATAAQREADVQREADANVSSLMGQLYKARATLQTVREERVALECSIRDAEAEFEGYRADDMNKSVLVRQVADAENAVAQLQADALRGQALASQLGEVLAQRNATISTKRRCAERSDEVLAQIQVLESQLLHLEMALNEGTNECERLRMDAAAYQGQRGALSQQRALQRKALQEETDRIRSEAAAQTSQWDRECAALAREVTDLDIYVKSLLSELDGKQTTIATYEREIERMQQERSERRAAAASALQSIMSADLL
jgi:hypothetical protein